MCNNSSSFFKGYLGLFRFESLYLENGGDGATGAGGAMVPELRRERDHGSILAINRFVLAES